MTLQEMWKKLERCGVSFQALNIITSINGYNEETFLDILYAHTGCRTFDQLEEEQYEVI